MNKYAVYVYDGLDRLRGAIEVWANNSDDAESMIENCYVKGYTIVYSGEVDPFYGQSDD